MNRQVLITGATKNIGLSTAEYFAEKGFDVHVTSRSVESAQNVAKSIGEKFPDIKAYGYGVDISKLSEIKALFEQIRKNTDKLDVFVANAANLGIGYDIYNTDEQMFDKIVDTNIKGTFFCCKEAGRLMKNGGSIVFVSSVQGKGAVGGRTVYGMTKGAVNTLAKFLAYDFAPYHIRVNTAILGAVHSERWDELPPDDVASRRANYPLGREASAREVANAIYYIAAEQTAATGSEITVDSGVMLSLTPYKERKIENHDEYFEGETQK